MFIHPQSVAFSCGSFPSGWCCYTEVTETSKVYAREVSMIPVYALLLFGGRLSVQHEAGTIQVDGWATLRAPAKIATLVSGLRREVEAMLQRKIEEPGLDISRSRVVDAMLQLLKHDGF